MNRRLNRSPAAIRYALFGGALLMCALVEAQPSPAPQPLQSAQIVDHLEHTIAWFRRVQTLEQQADLSSDPVSRQRLHQSSLAALQLAFDFARATVPLVKPEPTAPAPAPAGPRTERGFDQAATRLAERVATLQSRLDAANAALTRAPARSRAALAGQRDELVAALALAKDVQSTVQNLAQFAATSTAASDAANSLVGQVNELERTIPEARHTQSTKSTTATTVQSKPVSGGTATTSFRPESAGLVALATELVALGGQRRQLTEALHDTDALAKGIDDLRAPLIAPARDFARRTDVAAAPPANAAEAAQRRLDLQNAAAQFKTLSTALVPLGEQGIAVDTTRGTLGEWRDDLSERVEAAARQLLLRSLLLLVAIGALLIVSEIWRRATFRYLHDSRRRRQFLVLRRVVVAIAITLTLVAGFVSEIGSLATYAGFVTAGIAVALQNVILAVVAVLLSDRAVRRARRRSHHAGWGHRQRDRDRARPDLSDGVSGHRPAPDRPDRRPVECGVVPAGGAVQASAGRRLLVACGDDHAVAGHRPRVSREPHRGGR